MSGFFDKMWEDKTQPFSAKEKEDTPHETSHTNHVIKVVAHAVWSFLVAYVCVWSPNNCYAQNIKLCMTDSPVLADLTLGFTNMSVLADINVAISNYGLSDVDVCFLDHPTPTSIDVEFVNSSILADVSVCITKNTILANKTICITNLPSLADVVVGFHSAPTVLSKDVYLKGVDLSKLTNEEKIVIVYRLGLLKKK